MSGKKQEVKIADSNIRVIAPEDVEEEAKIKETSFYYYSGIKVFLFAFFSICTGFILPALAYWKIRLYIWCCCVKSSLKDATVVLIDGEDGTTEWIKIHVKQLALDGTVKSYRTFTYRLYVYYLDEANNVFKPVQFLIKNESYESVHETMGKGIKTQDLYSQRLLTYGRNATNIPVKSSFRILLEECLSPFYLFQVMSIVLWSVFEEYYIYASVIGGISLLSIGLSFYSIKSHYNKLAKKAKYETKVKVYRPFNYEQGQKVEAVEVSSTTLVPGDLIEIPDDQVMPCDVILVSGTCIMNESMLTGESVPVIKHTLPTSKKTFNIHNDSQYIVYSGTKCLELKKSGKNGGPVVGVVLTTGFSTMKGRLVRSLLYVKPENFKFYTDAYKYVVVLALIALACFAYSIYVLLSWEEGAEDVAVHSLDIITISVPPALATCLTIGTEIATQRLEKKKISTKSSSKIIVAGKVGIMCFDKTGTLTEDSLDLYGAKVAAKDEAGSCSFQKTTKSEYHTKFNVKGGGAVKSNANQMLELMASCHSLAYVKGNLSGDPLDMRMFQSLNWNFKDDNKNSDDESCICSPPTHDENIKGYYQNEAQVLLQKRFEFVPKLQRMSVIVKDPKEMVQRVYVKGSPEMIKTLCLDNTVPADYLNRLARYTENGLRVIACATKTLKSKVEISDNLERDEFESELEFIGFLIFENKLKAATTGIIHKLSEADIKSVMITGDNPLTAVYMARECGIASKTKPIMLAQIRQSKINPDLKELDWKVIEPSKHQLRNQADTKIEMSLDEGEGIVKDITFDLEQVRTTENTLAFSGEALTFIKNNVDDKKLYKLILTKTAIFARMHPDQKAVVVEELQKQGQIVGMCGDGANDCPALKIANVGLSLSEAEASLAAPFLSRINDISAVDILLRDGRCALATSIQAFKYMALYSLIQAVNVVFLYGKNTVLSDMEFLYADLFLVLPILVTMNYTESRDKLSKKQPSDTLMTLPILTSVIGHILIVTGFQVFIGQIVINQDFYSTPNDLYPEAEGLDDMVNSYDTTVTWLVSLFQYLFTSIVFAEGKPFRKAVWTNWIYMINFVAAMAMNLIILFLEDDLFFEFFNEQNIPYNFRWIIFGTIIVNFIVHFFYEQVIVNLLCVHISEKWAKKREMKRELQEENKKQIKDAATA